MEIYEKTVEVLEPEVTKLMNFMYFQVGSEMLLVQGRRHKRKAEPRLSPPPPPAHRHRPFLRGGPPPLSRRAQEGLRLRGVSADPRKVHQHVRRAGRTEEHEVQRQERPLGLQAVGGGRFRQQTLDGVISPRLRTRALVSVVCSYYMEAHLEA